jgi:integrase
MGKPDRCFDICYRSQKGKLIWEKIGWASEGYTAVMASHVRAERVRSLRHGDELPRRKTGEVTLGEVWERYDQWLETAKSRPRDERGYYKNHLKHRFEDRPLSKITPFDLEKLKIQLTKKGLAPASVKHFLVLVRQIINKAIDWNMWKGENPVKKIKLPKLKNRRERFLSQEEAFTLFEALKKVSMQLHDMALLSLHTGMRAGEIFALLWQHIDFKNNLIHIADPKSGRARKAFMTPTVRVMLKSRGPGKPEELIFKARGGGQIKEVSSAFSRMVEKLGFNKGITDQRQKATFHTLRHTFASWLALKGNSLLVIKELLGHQSLAMTERYSHLIPDIKRQAVEGIDKLFEDALKDGNKKYSKKAPEPPISE